MMGHHLNVSLVGQWWPTNSGKFWSYLPSSVNYKKSVKAGPLWQNFMDPRMSLSHNTINNIKIVDL